MLVPGLVYVSRYALTIPFVDEWAFIPVLFGEQPAGPWLWQLHNEHRFPLPRIVYLEMFWLTGDLRAGCFVSFLGISLCAAGLMQLARRVRGRSSITDAVFTLMLMHTGQGENLYMGYQMCFMLVTVLAMALLALIARSARTEARGSPPSPPASGGEGWGEGGLRRQGTSEHSGPPAPTPLTPTLSPRSGGRGSKTACFATGIWAILLGWLLLTCGAAGLCYGVAAAAWAAVIAVGGPIRLWQRLVLIALVAITPLYIVLYFQGYHRPSHHPESAGVFESLRIGLEAQAMAFGPAATGLWPAIGIGILIAGCWVTLLLCRRLMRSRTELLTIGLLLFIAAAAAVAFGIGWGRSGFHNDMGFAWRYGWLTFPPIAAAYFTWLMYGGRVSRYAPAALFVGALIFAPVNSISGFWDAETKLRPFEAAWKADVCSGMTADELIRKHFPNYSPASRNQMADMVRLMRDRHYTYYESLGRESP